MNPSDQKDHPRQVDGGGGVMDVEVANITQLTDSVQLTKPRNLLSENDSDARMDLDGDSDPSTSKPFPSAHGSGLGVLGNKPKRGQDEDLATGDEAVLAGHIKPTLADDSRDVYAIFRGLGSHEDDLDDSEWLDGVSVRADTHSIIGGDSEDEYDGETGEDDDEMLSGDEAVLAGAPDVVTVNVWD